MSARAKVTEHKAIAVRLESGLWTIGLKSPFLELAMLRAGDYEMSHAHARSSARAINEWGAAAADYRNAFKW